MAVEIEAIDTRTASEATLIDLHEFYHSVDAEYLPDDPPEPFERRKLDWQNIPDDEAAPRWVLRDGGVIVAAGVAWINLEQNLDNGAARVHVDPDSRGQGFARALTAPVLEFLKQNGRTRVDTHVKLGSTSEGYPARLGLKSVQVGRLSRLRIEDLDMGLMAEWSARASERASEYEIVMIESPYPDHLLEDFCRLASIMNTAPRDDYEMDDWALTPQVWRDVEAKTHARAADINTAIAIHSPSGDFAGYTTIQTDRLRPDQAWQWDTGVDPAHRNKGLGRWLKAALIENVLAGHPQIDRVDTWNAGSNEPMLNINVAMGFKGILETATWQGDLQTAIDRV